MIKASSIVALVACLGAGTVHAADRAELLSRIDGGRISVDAFVAKNKNIDPVVADVEAARGYVRKAAAALENGRQLFGFGGIKPEAEQEILHCLVMSDLNITLAESRLAKNRYKEELATITAQLDKVTAKVKRFDDRKAELVKLREEAARSDSLAKEVAQLKADKALLSSQVEMLMGERKDLEKLRAERNELARKIEELSTANRKVTTEAEAARPVSGSTTPSPAAKPALEPALIPAVVKQPVLQEKRATAGAAEAPLVELITPEKQDIPADATRLEPLREDDLSTP